MAAHLRGVRRMACGIGVAAKAKRCSARATLSGISNFIIAHGAYRLRCVINFCARSRAEQNRRICTRRIKIACCLLRLRRRCGDLAAAHIARRTGGGGATNRKTRT